MTWELRTARSSDLDAVLALEQATDTAPRWPLSAYAAIVEGAAPNRWMIVAHSREALVGFAVGMVQRDPVNIGELESVAVAATARRAGIGHALCSAVIEWCRCRGATEMVLEVRATSAGPRALYAALGFTETGLRPGYYRNPEDDAIIMIRKLL